MLNAWTWFVPKHHHQGTNYTNTEYVIRRCVHDSALASDTAGGLVLQINGINPAEEVVPLLQISSSAIITNGKHRSSETQIRRYKNLGKKHRSAQKLNGRV